MPTILIKSATIVNENKQFIADLLIKDGLIDRIDNHITDPSAKEINAEGLYLFPAVRSLPTSDYYAGSL